MRMAAHRRVEQRCGLGEQRGRVEFRQVAEMAAVLGTLVA